MPVVVKVAGKARRANVDGETVLREELIYVPSERSWVRQLDTYDHFCYYNKRKLGATMLCSCGSQANIYGYEAYRQFQSVNMGRVIACMSLVENKHHADGSIG